MTFFRTDEVLSCVVPPLSEMQREASWRGRGGPFIGQERADVPICIVRDDGVIYSTHMTFTYQATAAGHSHAC